MSLSSLSSRARRRPPRLAAGALVFGLLGLHCSDDPVVTANAPYGLEARPERSPCRPPVSPAPITLTPAFPGVTFERPTRMVRPRAEAPWYVLEQGGRIQAVLPDGGTFTYLDLRAKVFEHDEEAGLLGLVFSPAYATTGELFVSYTGRAPEGSPAGEYRTVVSRFRQRLPLVPGGQIDPATEEVVLTVPRVDGWHHSGAMAFGPDRYLYLTIGDGSFGDTQRRAPNPNELFGKVLRLDVLGETLPYGIPADNPFVGLSGRPEVYATGFRNPWNMSFGPDGRLWVADVGHFRWEEVDVVEKGGFYGWPYREGTHCTFGDGCPDDGKPPVVEYSHVEGQAIIGGFVYEGKRLPGLVGRYVYGDFGSGRLWSIDASSTARPAIATDLVDTGLNPASFGRDVDGELFLVDYVSGGLYRLDPGSSEPEEKASLKSLGCVDGQGNMDARLVPYDVTAPLWSDGLAKRRFVSVPDGASIRRKEDGSWDYPVGTVLLKEFAHGARRIETRMMALDEKRGWLGYTFEWNAEGTDATLLTEGKHVDLGTSTWDIPGRATCATCHNATAGRVLGFQASQLNRDYLYPSGVVDNQLRTLSHVGLVEGIGDPALEAHLVDPYAESEDLEARVRSYMQGNCAHCHRVRGLDFRAQVSLLDTGLVCKPAYATSVGDATELVVPGDPTRSIMYLRISDTGELRMPPLGTHVPDTRATDLVKRWITGLQGCP